jgi:hypothetical protein
MPCRLPSTTTAHKTKWWGWLSGPTITLEIDMPYCVLKSCFAGGAKRAAGDVIELDEAEAKSLIAMARVSYVEARPAKEELEDRSIGLGLKKPTRRARKT